MPLTVSQQARLVGLPMQADSMQKPRSKRFLNARAEKSRRRPTKRIRSRRKGASASADALILATIDLHSDRA
jgi:hypothetical protein